MNAPTNLDYLASILALIILVVSALTLFGMGILMAAGAVFSKRPLVTSWPVDQESTFATYEDRGSRAGSQAWILSILGAVALGVFATGVYFGVAPDKRDIARDMNMSNLTKKRAPAPSKTEAAPPAEAPTPDTPAPPAPKQ